MADQTRWSAGARVLVRNFYGGLRVRDNGENGSLDAMRTLTHGTINHGEEYLNLARRDLPTTYYGPNTGVGMAIREKQKTGAIRIGVIGLGTGTIAAYGRLGDYIRYYEINPLVLRVARKEFFFLKDCKAKLDVAMGDARLSLEREPPQNFDVLAVDAFSSDSIPVHLLTKEAMELYFRHLRPDGILAVHISNRYLDLQPVLAGRSSGHRKDRARGGYGRRRYAGRFRRYLGPDHVAGHRVYRGGVEQLRAARFQVIRSLVDRRLQQPFQDSQIALL